MKRFSLFSTGLTLALGSAAFAQSRTTTIAPKSLGKQTMMSSDATLTRVQQVAGGVLLISTNNAQQQIEFNVGPVPGEVTVSGVSTIPSGQVFTGVTAIDLTTGRAQDYVEFRIFTAAAPSIRVNTGLGNSDVKFIYDLPFSTEAASSLVEVFGSSGEDKVDFLVESRAASFAAEWSVNAGANNNEITASVNSPELSDSLAINLNGTATTGVDKLELAVIHNAASAEINFGGALGGNTDFASLIVDGLDGALTADTALNVDLGTGIDGANVEIISRGGEYNTSGQILGGDGGDTLVFKQEEGVGTVDLTLDGGAGNDLLDMFMKGQISGTPRLLGGAGNDELKLVVDGPQLATPFLDGGAGFDIAIGFGTIVNVEQIN